MFRKALLLVLFFSSSILVGQDYRAMMQQAIENGFQPPTGCGYVPSASSEFKSACTVSTDSYGTDCFNPTSAAGTNNIDPACTVQPTPVPACGTTFKVPIAITIFEDPAWTGSNYMDFTNCGGGGSTGFVPLTDADINTKIAELNAVYCNANIEFFECKTRQRVNNPDLYNWYTSPADPENGTDDDDESTAFDNPNVIDIYFVGGINGDHDCAGTTGYARLPPSRDYFLMVYRGTFGTTFEHEFGHYFGLDHTHWNGGLNNDNPGTNPITQPENTDTNNCGCLTTDDRICDTWPDPNFEAVASFTCAFNSPPQPALPIDPALGTSTSGTFNPLCTEPVSTVLLTNIMGYNQFQGCRTTFSPCQLNKIQDALFNCRSNLCCDDPTQYFAAGAETMEICAGDPAPMFTANTTCVDWYGQAIAGAALATGSTTFTPTIGTGMGELDNMTAGTYSFFVQDQNAFGDCRIPVTVTVLPDPMAATSGGATGPLDACAGGSFPFETATAVVADPDIVGWYFSDSDPSGSSGAALTTAINGAANNNTLNPSTGNIIQSDTGSPLNNLNALAIDCAALEAAGGDGTYYMTPFIASAEEPVVCSVVATSSAISFGGNPTGAVTAATGPITGCAGTGTPVVEMIIEVTEYSGATSGTIFFDLRDSSEGCNGAGGFGENLPCGSVPCTLTLTETDLEAASNFGASFDPFVDSWCITGLNSTFTGVIDLSYTVTLQATYPSQTAVESWDANGTPILNFDSSGGTSCLLGESIEINCVCASCEEPTAVSCSNPGLTTMDVSWTAPATAPDGYVVQYAPSGSGLWGTVQTAANTHPWINEIHYDNSNPSTDTDEGIELAGPARLDLSCYTLLGVNGSNGTVITNTITPLSGLIDDEVAGMGAVWFPISGLQNGAPDGVALIYTGDGTCDCPGTVGVSEMIQFLSYEASPFDGDFSDFGLGIVTSVDIVVDQQPAPDPDLTLQLSGCGDAYADFAWAEEVAQTRGDLNVGQVVFMNTTTSLTAVNLDPCTNYDFRVASVCCASAATAFVNAAAPCETLSPDETLTVTTDSPVCEGEDATVMVMNSEMGIYYTLLDGANAAIGATQAGTGGTLSFTIPTANISTIGGSPYAFNIEASICDCSEDLTAGVSIVVEDCSLDCPTSDNPATMENLCDGGVPTLPVPVITDDDNTQLGAVMWFDGNDPTTATAYAAAATAHSGANICAADAAVVVFAFVQCDADANGVFDLGAGDSWVAVGQHTFTVYPNPQIPTITRDDNVCAYTVSAACFGDGLSPSSFGPTTPGDAAGTTSITVTSGIGGNPCAAIAFDVAYDACPAADCPTSDNPMTMESICDGDTPSLPTPVITDPSSTQLGAVMWFDGNDPTTATAYTAAATAHSAADACTADAAVTVYGFVQCDGDLNGMFDLSGGAAMTVFEDDFSGGGGNWTQAGSAGFTSWVFDANYAAGALCTTATDDQGGGSYMHTAVPAFGCTQTVYLAGGGTAGCTTMGPVSTVGLTGVAVNFDYLVGGAAGDTYGVLEYSTDGAAWTGVTGYSPEMPISTTWSAGNSVTDAAFDNQGTLFFRFCLEVGAADSDPGLGVDNFSITSAPVASLDSWVAVGTHTYTVYPEPQAPSITRDDDVCNHTLTPACPGDVLNPATITTAPGDAASMASVTVTSGIVGNPCGNASVMVMVEACPALPVCPTSDDPATSESLCDGGTPTLPVPVITDNDNTQLGAVMWFDGNDPTTATAYAAAATAHSAADVCAADAAVTVYAFIQCDLDGNGAFDTAAGDSWVQVAEHAFTIYPVAQTPTITRDDAVCNYTVTPACATDVLSVTTFGPTAPGDAAGTVSIDVTSGLAGTPCPLVNFSVAYSACDALPVCPTSDFVSSTEAICDGDTPTLPTAIMDAFVDFDDCPTDASYTNGDPYTCGSIQTENAILSDVGSGAFGDLPTPGVRIRNQAGSYLLYQGSDGNGKDGGIGDVCFDYRAWDTAPALDMDVEYSTDGGMNWINIGNLTGSPSMLMQFCATVDVAGDDILVRIINNAGTGERMHVDNLSITSFDPAGTGYTISDPDGTTLGGIQWFDGDDPLTDNPYTAAAAAHSGADACAADATTTVYAFVQCDLDMNGVFDTAAGDSWVEVASHDFTVYPAVQAPTIARDDNTCSYTVTPACAGDALTPATFGPTSPGDPAGTTMINVSSGIVGNPCLAADFSVSYEACPSANCPTSDNPATTEALCDGGLPTLPVPVIADPDGTLIGMTMWFDGNDPATAATYTAAAVAHSGADACVADAAVTVYAFIQCDANGDDAFDTADGDSWIAAGTHSFTVYPEVQVPTITRDDNTCSYTVTPACAGDALTPATFGPTSPGDAAGTTMINVSSGIVGNPCLAADFSVSYEACPSANCPTSDNPATTEALCDGGLPSLPVPVIADPDGTLIGMTMWFDGNDPATAAPYSVAAVGHSGVDACAADAAVTVYAFVQCDSNFDGAFNTADGDSWIAAGTHTFTVYPEVQAPTIARDNDDCTYTITPACAGDLLTPATLSTNPGDAAGTTMINVSSGIVGNPCAAADFSVAYDACPMASGCTLTTSSPVVTCDAVTFGTDMYTVSIDFDNGAEGAPGAGGYTISQTFGGDNPMVTQSGTITFSFMEGGGYNITINGVAGTGVNEMCALSFMGASPECEPAATITNDAPQISDPCVCQDDEDLAAGIIGSFYEEILIVGAPGEVWTYTTAGSAGLLDASRAALVDGTVVPEVNPGEYILGFYHLDGVGYNGCFTNGTDVLCSNNTCYYPDVVIDALDATYCELDPMVTLSATASVDGSAVTGSASFTIDGVAAAVLDPAALPAGDYTIAVTFVADGTAGTSNPGCTSSASVEVTIAATCDAGCNDPNFCEYDPEALIEDNSLCVTPNTDPGTCDDGDCSNGVEVWDFSSCECVTIPPSDNIFGCSDPAAFNYDADALCDDGSCIELSGKACHGLERVCDGNALYVVPNPASAPITPTFYWYETSDLTTPVFVSSELYFSPNDLGTYTVLVYDAFDDSYTPVCEAYVVEELHNCKDCYDKGE